MAISNRDRVGRAFEMLAVGLRPYVDRRMHHKSPHGKRWFDRFCEQAPGLSGTQSLDDPSILLRVMADCWDLAFKEELTRTDRNVVFILRDYRNKWAHNAPFNHDEAYRALDACEQLLGAIDAKEADEVGKAKDDLMRIKYEAEAKKATPKPEALFAEPVAGLRPWREVVIPHDDVARGRFSHAEFAADLEQVRRGEAADEYRDPVEFFQRTYLTQGLRQLLSQAVQRVAGSGGSPVVDLQTNFGGGKTHSMIALYHLFSGLQPHEFPQEVQDLLRDAGITELPGVNRAVLVGTKVMPGQTDVKPDGTEVRTLWGELAWQLGGTEGYALVADSDRTAKNPGVALREVFKKFGPCLILVDEWVAYARQLVEDDSLPAGTFDTHFTFAQALTEEATAVPGTLLVVSIPASDSMDDANAPGSPVELGGPGGIEALRRLRQVVARVESSWRPASAEESFEIVRRRLFQPIEPGALVDRDATAKAFVDFYKKHANEFPVECREKSYEDRIKAAYPIHPELFARLYEDWSTLERFQRTRGVLRLMADVIHALWEGGDRSPLILPSSVPLSDTAVSTELTLKLEDSWKPILDTDIDGPASVAVALDNTNSMFGRYSAARRVARAVFLGSAPRAHSPHRGMPVERVRLACAVPGESVATYGDALGRLSDRSTYLFVEGQRYWYGTQPGVARLARDRADRLLTSGRDEVHTEITRRIRLQAESRADRGDFAAVHVAPATPADVPDIAEVRLVVLGPDSPHIGRSEATPALDQARAVLEQRGSAPRDFRNMVVFLAADHKRLEDLERGAAEFLAWRSVDEERADLNLDAYQTGQAQSKRNDADKAVDLRLAEAYHWLVVPAQPDPTGPITFDVVKADGQGRLAERASRKLVNQGALSPVFGPQLLRVKLDGVLSSLWKDGHVTVNAVWDAFARYVYLPRLKSVQTLIETAERGPGSINWQAEGYAVAEAFDDAKGSYLGLVAGENPVGVSGVTLLVRPDVAAQQVEATPPPSQPQIEGEVGGERDDEVGSGDVEGKSRALRRFYGSVTLAGNRPIRSFQQVSEEVIQHLSSVVGSDVRIVVEIEATHPDGYDEKTIRTVLENAATLKFDDKGFEPA